MQFKNHPKNFCVAPWQASYYKESKQQYKMCCVFDEWSKAESPEDYFNSDLVKDVRQTILDGKWHKGCSVCKEQEEAGLDSDRTSFNNNLDINNNPVNTDKFKLKWLDYRPGNLCNLKCRMCSGTNSSMIQDEVEKHPELKLYTNESPVVNTDLLPSICNFETFKDLEFLKILGGEPTIDPQIQKLLDWVCTNDLAKNITLRYTSNATNYNNKWVEAVNQFKKCKIQISLDGTGDTYEYIRTNANWNKVKQNVIEMPTKINNITGMGTNIVWSLYNCFTVDEWYPELVELTETVKQRYGFYYDLHIIDTTWPDYIMVRNLPNEFKDIVLDKLNKLPQDKMVKSLQYYTQRESKQNVDIKDFFGHNDILDKIRKTNINNISPFYEKLRQTTIQ